MLDHIYITEADYYNAPNVDGTENKNIIIEDIIVGITTKTPINIDEAFDKYLELFKLYFKSKGYNPDKYSIEEINPVEKFKENNTTLYRYDLNFYREYKDV